MPLITRLKKNEIFVFGSNLLGVHAAGAAADAKKKFGAKDGVGEGMTGRCYAFPTLGKQMKQRTREELETSAKRILSSHKYMPNRDKLVSAFWELKESFGAMWDDRNKDAIMREKIPSNI